MNFELKKSLIGTAIVLPAMGLSIVNADSIQTLTINHTVNFRMEASKYSDRLGNFKVGEKVTYLGEEGDWYKVQHEDQVGYIYKKYATPDFKAENTNITKYVNCSGLNLRSKPSTSSSVIKVLKEGRKVTVLSTEGKWSKVAVGSFEGYVNNNYLSDKKPTEDKTVKYYRYIAKSSTSLKKSDSSSANSICTIKKNTKVGVIKSEDGWSKVKYNGSYGYVKSTNLSKSKVQATTTNKSEKIDKMMRLAASKIGCRYVRGSEGPNTFDCSGFTSYLYKQIGVNIPRSSSQQKNAGTYVSKSNLQKGDLVLLDTSGNGSVDHACIYVGNGEIIHANSSAGKITRSDLNSSYYRGTYVCARRIL